MRFFFKPVIILSRIDLLTCTILLCEKVSEVVNRVGNGGVDRATNRRAYEEINKYIKDIL